MHTSYIYLIGYWFSTLRIMDFMDVSSSPSSLMDSSLMDALHGIQPLSVSTPTPTPSNPLQPPQPTPQLPQELSPQLPQRQPHPPPLHPNLRRLVETVLCRTCFKAAPSTRMDSVPHSAHYTCMYCGDIEMKCFADKHNILCSGMAVFRAFDLCCDCHL